MKTPIDLPDGRARVVDLAEVRTCEAWLKAFANRCKDARFYELIEQSVEGGFEHHYLILEDRNGNVRAVQPFFFVQQNVAEGVRGNVRDTIEFIRRRFPRFLTMRVLMVGCVIGEGHLGVIDNADEQWAVDALHSSLKIIAKRAGASLVVLKDFPSEYRGTLAAFAANGYARIPSMPMTRLPLRFGDFEEYLGTLSKVTRKSLRRKFRKADDAGKLDLDVVNDISPYIDEVYPLYLQVHERSPMKFERLTKEYLCALGHTMPERARFFVWRQRDKIIAFSVCMICGGTLYDEYLGMDYSVALDLHLYFQTFRDVVTWAITNGLTNYCSSPLNYDPKLHLGHELVPLDLYVMHTTAWINPVFRRVVKLLEPTRHDPVLQRFPNADQL